MPGQLQLTLLLDAESSPPGGLPGPAVPLYATFWKLEHPVLSHHSTLDIEVLVDLVYLFSAGSLHPLRLQALSVVVFTSLLCYCHTHCRQCGKLAKSVTESITLFHSWIEI